MMTPQLRIIIGLSLALTVSLCANAFMGGMMLVQLHPSSARGARVTEMQDPRERSSSVRGAMREFLSAVPQEARAPLMQAMQGQRSEMAEKMRSVTEARRRTMSVMQSEPFNAARLREALLAQRTAQLEIQTTVHESIIRALEDMTPEQRRYLGGAAGRLFK